MAPVLQARGEALEQADGHLSKARLKRFERSAAYVAVQEGLTLTPNQCGARSGAGRPKPNPNQCG
eukprot:scaffold89981_cov63-Phaeocystis_antarctica.AAC.1